MGHCDTAQICLNGHIINSNVETSPEFCDDYCSDCGASTIKNCTNCDTKIRGDYNADGVIAVGGFYSAPRHCRACGEAFPWISEKVAAAQELADELDELSPEDRVLLKASIVDLSNDSARTELASFRYKKLVKKAGVVGGDALNKIMVCVMTAAAKSWLGL